ncbi:MAG: curli assembly protein CsgC [Yokenella regensburgei]|jgi:curli production protein|uniref:Curli assembly protein CsgC n=1 Tax=Yokenella regensburgei TaxID=158877 RepID=A0AB38FQU4_9ENTR|nr:curli assembly chaperone CsgC [Yokenella regensburgei]EHM47230.1 curli assembly protein CsgC family protein [Yokenella regensburgei ATCC 43003]KFD19543.1 putative curli production protein [Yokenella regensburgei ATCC 49455]MDQ4431704.1 curli assembly chaperone CsgC [Yokenella regensburgei]MDR3104308.1 curli assembly protein CsgC [Yokenella regensburgei]QIU88326.1 curli assembly protein CsgC [Yokenella regensburgei]
MHSLLLLVALTNQITFNVDQQGEIYTIIPQVTLSQPCDCQVQIQTLRQGQGGTSQIQQSKQVSLPANQAIDLPKLSINLTPEDTVSIVVTVTDGQSLHLSQQWVSASKA